MAVRGVRLVVRTSGSPTWTAADVRCFFVHLHDVPGGLDEEVVVTVAREDDPVAIKAPLDALADLLPILRTSTADVPDLCCPACGQVQPAPRDED